MTLNQGNVRTDSDLPIGSRDYRAFVGSPQTYDAMSALQFNLLTLLGLRDHSSFLDIGCGSLRGGRLFITYLLPGRYCGVEPEQWLIDEGIRHEVGRDLIDLKQPLFSNDGDFTLSVFDRQFDFILAQSIFSHASEPQINRCLGEARKVMGPASIFVATFVEGDQNYSGKDWVYPGCTTYTLARMIQLAEEHGLACEPIDWPHSAQQRWLVMTDPVNQAAIPDLNDTTRLLALESELALCKRRLSKIEQHPYVRFGLAIVSHRWYVRVRSGAAALLGGRRQ